MLVCTFFYSLKYAFKKKKLNLRGIWFVTAFTNYVAFWVIPSHVGIDSQTTLEGPIEQVARVEAEEAENLLRDLGIPVQ